MGPYYYVSQINSFKNPHHVKAQSSNIIQIKNDKDKDLFIWTAGKSSISIYSIYIF